MQAKNITAAQLQAAADEIGVMIDSRPLNAKGTRHQVKVSPRVSQDACTASGRRRSGTAGDTPYQRISASPFNAGRRVHAVCWHGFRDFFRACYARAPETVFRTTLDTWKGQADFEARYPESAAINWGSLAAPVAACNACRCPDTGRPY